MAGLSAMQAFGDRLFDDPLKAILTGAADRHASWAVGGLGELLVAQHLEQLPAGWYTTHDVALGHRGNIDHVLVGPPGVFTLNTKYHGSRTVLVAGDAVGVDGRVVPYVSKAEHEVRRARTALRRYLDSPAHLLGLVVVVSEEYAVLRPQTSPTARVVHVDQLLQVLRRKRPVLSDCSVKRLTRAVRDPATWRPS